VEGHCGFQHEALIYQGDDGFLAGVAPFVRDALAHDERVMVAVIERRARILRSALGEDAERAVFVDMAELGHNPAKIIPAWMRFVEEFGASGHPVRGVGEPIWLGRRDEEIAEAELHESLLNVAIDPDTPLWLRCPYDAMALAPSLIKNAARSHPVLVEHAVLRGSPSYQGLTRSEDLFGSDLPAAPANAEAMTFGPADTSSVRELVRCRAMEAGLSEQRVAGLEIAVNELVTNSVGHGGGQGVFRIWRCHDALVCDITDEGRIEDLLIGRRAPRADSDGARGVWLVNQLCDLVQIRSTPEGTSARVFSWLRA
jgi:anti-sigma regulatory factor (Ser/Thr protein kinase)